jgi:GNAT superfamily N-acetyltransferase
MESKRVDKYWSSFFGLTPNEMKDSGVRVLPHQELSDYKGAWVFRHNSLTVVSVPNDLCELVRQNAEAFNGDLLTENWIHTTFNSRVERIIGPAYHGYVDSSHFRPASSLGARRLSGDDVENLRQLSQACGEAEWEHSGIFLGGFGAANEPPTFGCFADGDLVAASQYWHDKHGTAKGGVITHPAYCNQGFGKAVRSATVEDCVNQGYTMLYQTLLSNHSAVAVANALGFEQYATHLAVRFE